MPKSKPKKKLLITQEIVKDSNCINCLLYFKSRLCYCVYPKEGTRRVFCKKACIQQEYSDYKIVLA